MDATQHDAGFHACQGLLVGLASVKYVFSGNDMSVYVVVANNIGHGSNVRLRGWELVALQYVVNIRAGQDGDSGSQF